MPHLVVTGIVAPEKPDMAIDVRCSLEEDDIAPSCQPAIQQILHPVELINL